MSVLTFHQYTIETKKLHDHAQDVACTGINHFAEFAFAYDFLLTQTVASRILLEMNGQPCLKVCPSENGAL
jgi:hypothetical protein